MTVPSLPLPRSVVDLFVAQARRTPDATAVSFRGERLSYRSLDARTEALAALLRDRGVTRDTPVGIACERSFAMVTSVLAVLKAGGAYLPLDPSYPQDRLEYMLDLARTRLVLTTSALRTAIDSVKPTGAESLCVDTLTLDGTAASPLASTTDGEDLAYVIFTSGSTGQPKGVAMRHGALLNLMQWQLRQSQLHLGARTIQFSPLSFDVSFQETFATWLSGGELVLVTDDLRLEPRRFLSYLVKERIERLFLPFIALQHLAEIAATIDVMPTSLREVVTAGEQLQATPQVKAFFSKLPNCRLYNHYGPSETHVVTSLTLPRDPTTWPALPSIGAAIDGVELLILDEAQKPVHQTAGELYIGGVALARGYLHRPELTAERFVTLSGKRYYRTGDLAEWHADGNVQFLGRIDGQVKVRGYRVELGEIEVALASFPAVTQVAVTVREDVPGDKRLVAYLVAESGRTAPTSSLRRHLQDKLPDYMLPSTFVWVAKLPRTPSGKIDRRALPKPEAQRPELDQPYLAPRSDIERTLATLWGAIIQVDQVGVNDNFFELGGNSLLAVTMLTRCKQETGYDIPIVKLFQYPTIAGITRYLEEGDGQSLNDVLQRAQRRRRDAVTASDVAIVGMAGRFPGASNVDELWANLCAGKETTRFFDAHELDPSQHDAARQPDYVAARGILADADKFDAGFFAVNRHEATVMDPQQRLFLEVAWQAFEHAGYAVDRFDGAIGVYAGAHNNSYYAAYVARRPDLIEALGSFPTMLASEKDYLATRVTHKLNLKGPGVNVQTACSTSLVAVHLAVQALRQHECDMALAGGAAVSAPLMTGHTYVEGGMLSRDGHCRPFDADATGTVFSDGIGAVVLKRLEDARRDEDTIYAVIKGTAINNDGADKASFTAPSVAGQAAVVALALADANVDSRSISYVEAHGTATPLGDPIEVEALTTAHRLTTTDRGYCGIGSIKGNFGHLTAAAGIAGLIKTALALKHEKLPPSLHFRRANTAIDFDASPFHVVSEVRAWPRGPAPRRAGVSSFGVGGTNAHLILEEAPLPEASSPGRDYQLFALSAKSAAALDRASTALADHLSHVRPDAVALADIAYTTQVGRVAFQERRVVVAASADEVIQQLTAPRGDHMQAKSAVAGRPQVAFAFPGQGAQYARMGHSLYDTEPVYRATIDACCEVLTRHTQSDLRTALYATSGDAGAALRQTSVTQPALFVTGYALAQLWRSWGVEPQVLVGHSIGEFVAATLAEVMTLEDALALVAERGRLMQTQPEGAMLSVRMAADQLVGLLDPSLAIAAINSPTLCVVAGPSSKVDSLAVKLGKLDVACKPLMTSHAFHSSMMDAVVGPIGAMTAKMNLRAPKIPIVSTVTGNLLTNTEARSPEYWAMHLRRTVNFAGAVAHWWAEPRRLLLELGPRRTLSTLAMQQVKDRSTQTCVSTLGEDADGESKSVVTAIGQLWLSGVAVDWTAYHARERRRRLPFPSYSFEKSSYWAAPGGTALTLSGEKKHPMNAAATQQRYAQELKELFEGASGVDFATSDFGTSFLEMGLDSLFLTQVTLKLKKKYGIALQFRQLLETYTSINALAAYIAAQIPDAAPAPVAATPSTAVAETPAASVGPVDLGALDAVAVGDGVAALIARQLIVMQQQLAVLGGAKLPAAMPTVAGESKLPSATSAEALKPTRPIGSKVVNDAKKAFGAQARITVTDDRGLNSKQKQAFDAFVVRYNARTKKSKELTARDRQHMADPRVVTGFRPVLKELIYQPVVDRSEGCRIWDIDGNEYVDVLCGFGSNMLGHGAPMVVKAVGEQLKRGYEIGPQHPLAGEVAKMVCEFTGLDRAGFCNTGSEAVMGAMRIARTTTGRDKIAIFTGSYHGIFDEVIVRGTKKFTGIPAAAGIMNAAVENVVVLDYGTQEALDYIRQHGEDLAAVMVEPIQSRRPDFQPREFLHALRDLTTKCGAALIFDEVITGFRLHPRGAQGYFGVRADIASYGKVVGGGMPIGVIAGQRPWIDALDGGSWAFGDTTVPEVGVTYFAGTFVRHPLALAAAKATLEHLKAEGPKLQSTLNQRMDAFAAELNQHFESVKLPLKIKHFGSLFKAICTEDVPFGDLMFCWLRSKGLHIWDGFPCFFTTAHSDADIKFIVKTFKDTIKEMQDVELLPANAATTTATKNGKSDKPPVPGAKLGRDPNGFPAWYVADPSKPGQFIKVGDA